MSTRREILRLIESVAQPIYGVEEARIIARMLLTECYAESLSSLIAQPDEELQIDDLGLFKSRLELLGQGMPIQYIIGYADFDDMRLKVTQSVLIPRPETEELIYHIMQCSPNAKSILDVGTGSGAIALALKRRLPEARVQAVDISEEALKIAKENSVRLGIDIELGKGDALNLEQSVSEKFDIIVSNPPYIPQSEELEMCINVTRYEPHLALFVPDSDPLIFYRRIARSAFNLLNSEGSLWFEIHEHFSNQMVEMLTNEGFTRNEVILDINNKPRIVWSRR